MKNLLLLICGFILLQGCHSLDLNPLSDGSSETWNSTPEELEMSLNGLYKQVFWKKDLDDWSDDWIYRDGLTEVTNATLNGQSAFIKTWWLDTYKAIARANTIIKGADRAKDKLSVEQLNMFIAEARFVRACMYSSLLSHFGHIIYTDDILDIEQAKNLKQVEPEFVLQRIYEDFDFAIANLKTKYTTTELHRVTKGAAMAMKARIALYRGDFATARNAAKDCIDLKQYNLHTDFASLFLSSTKNSPESIFLLPRSIALNVVLDDRQNYISRNAGGWAAKDPSWDLLFSFICTDGLTVEKSPLFDPSNPFLYRDPRCKATIAAFDEPLLDYIYTPHPEALNVMKISTGTLVKNNDNRANAQYASFNGLVWKKGVDNEWLLNSWRTEPDNIIIRYADILLIYAEAKIELNEIDQTVVDAINQVRARAYGVASTSLDFPAVKLGDQHALRQILRNERRMEFALEGLRYMDLIRWKLAEKALNKPNYGLLDPADLVAKVVKTGKWFLPSAPTIDADGLPDFNQFNQQGLIKTIAIRKFDASKQYLWPIPSTEVLTSGLKQNPNY
ncbi:RagB/SusD family nutrient uptake outer membrane protein [Sphingobacterium sp. DR205]|uniref:RagB/SusD family nutrient uptake outer membrane protein n=1 Tax=Sphingobacterium sp. DR205 TaxID=2713573 RepID=UPI0013E41497|nr:RagB/SusD family nutrient uptake outer membrane protein [Sphingobacterium sp. DR205]QIH33622.1 RagB/SusD family nutrient uptake outer membrane protein [Sphingobacterium sp. DR205]